MLLRRLELRVELRGNHKEKSHMFFSPQGSAYEFIAKDVNLYVTRASDLSERNLSLFSSTPQISLLFTKQYSVISIKSIAKKIHLYSSEGGRNGVKNTLSPFAFQFDFERK